MKIKDLDTTEVYGLEEIKKDSVKFDMLKEWLKENDRGWNNHAIGELNYLDNLFFVPSASTWRLNTDRTTTKCALTLFDLDITDYQVDCSELSKEQINNLCNIFEAKGYTLYHTRDALDVINEMKYFRKYYNSFGIFELSSHKEIIEYDKFIELFGEKPIKQAEKELSEIIGTDVTKPVKYKTNALNIRLSNSDFKQITDSISDLLDYKNKKYGNSALEPLNIFANKCKTGQRLDDKLARVKNSSELKKNDVADLIGYLILTCKENNWTNFDEFKD